jgi:hypothetical protein
MRMFFARARPWQAKTCPHAWVHWFKKHLAGRLLFCPPTHLHCETSLCGPTPPQLSHIHLFSCGFLCKSTSMASEDLSARVGSLVQKNLTGRLLFCPPTHWLCDSSLCGPTLPQLSQIHLFSCGCFLQEHAYSKRRLVRTRGFTGSKKPDRETIVLSPDPLAL